MLNICAALCYPEHLNTGHLDTMQLRRPPTCRIDAIPATPPCPPQFMFLDKTPDSPLKAIDFGISVFCKPGQYIDVRAGTPIYIAPEVSSLAAERVGHATTATHRNCSALQTWPVQRHTGRHAHPH